jgi:hypothetical protein
MREFDRSGCPKSEYPSIKRSFHQTSARGQVHQGNLTQVPASGICTTGFVDRTEVTATQQAA